MSLPYQILTQALHTPVMAKYVVFPELIMCLLHGQCIPHFPLRRHLPSQPHLFLVWLHSHAIQDSFSLGYFDFERPTGCTHAGTAVTLLSLGISLMSRVHSVLRLFSVIYIWFTCHVPVGSWRVTYAF